VPKLVKELPQGKAFSRSAEGGTLADTATRTWKIVLNAPNEPFDISSEIGVNIGDRLDNANPIPCVSIDVKADGESRMVRIVTAQYRTTAGEGDAEQDPGLLSPDVRPANVSTSTSLHEVPASCWKWLDSDSWEAIANPVGDPVDGVTKLEPITTIRITQFSLLPGTVSQGFAGYINEDEMRLRNISGTIRFEPHTVMFRGVESSPHVETFGTMTYRGFMNSYEFSYRSNKVFGEIQVREAKNDPQNNWGVRDRSSTGYVAGWDFAAIINGYNCIAYDPDTDNADNLLPSGYRADKFAMPLKTDTNTGVIKDDPYELAEGIEEWNKVRAHVRVLNPQTGASLQHPSAMPIALGTLGHAILVGPDATQEITKPIIQVRQVQPSTNLVEALSLRVT